jgi:GNAT superfamily N-acetyltransferase
MRQVRLDLRGLEAPPVVPPPGITLVTLAERPDLVPAVHAVAIETFPGMPTGGDPMDAGTLDEFVAREVERPDSPGDAFQVALDEASGEAVGYASLMFAPGSTTVAWHAMTAVRPAYRGRGIATALKRATIAWAIGHGLESLETGNDVHNAPMRAVNAALGYEPMPDLIGLQGPPTAPAAPAAPAVLAALAAPAAPA